MTIASQGLNGFSNLAANLLSGAASLSQSRKGDLITCLRQTNTDCRCEICQSTYENYNTAVNLLEKFILKTMPDRRFTPANVTPGHIKALEHWLLDNGKSPNYCAQTMRSLKALFGRLNRRGSELFAQVRTSPYPTEKRAVNEEVIHQIATDDEVTDTRVACARDIFMVCFLCMGMPLIDAAHLRKSQLRDGRITYYRHKTHHSVTVTVEKELQKLLDRLTPRNSDFLLPILSGNDESQYMQQYRRFYQHYMRCLKRLSARISPDCRLTSYTPRHTWASIAHRKGIDTNTISQALAHANTQVTRVYINDICNEQLQNANKIVISAVK